MIKTFLPHLITARSIALPPAFFLSKGIQGLILDIDNTLVTYDDPTPTPEVAAWFDRLQKAGIRVAFVSNNSHERVRVFNENLGYYATGKSKKPFKKGVLRAIEALGLPKDRIALMGDQVFTDVCAGRRCGLFTILVPPIKDKTDLFTRCKRVLERPVLRAYRKALSKKAPVKLAVLGSPIAHSRSPLLHSTLGKLCGLPLTYEAIDTPQSALAERVKELQAKGYLGWNCTMPLKTDMAATVHAKSEAAARLDSVNTVLSLEDGTLYGDTTDGNGILGTLAHHGIDPKGKNVVLLGAGGAARSVADALLGAGAKLQVLNRTPKTFDGMEAKELTPVALQAACRTCDILVQTTSLGMAGKEDFSDLSFLEALPAHAFVIDAVYHPLKTTLLRRSEALGLSYADGLWMLVYQGICSFTAWTGIAPDRKTAQILHEVLAKSLETEEKEG